MDAAKNEIDCLMDRYNIKSIESIESIESKENTEIRDLKLKIQDLSIEYNNKIDRLKQMHRAEIAELHAQYVRKMNSINPSTSNKS